MAVDSSVGGMETVVGHAADAAEPCSGAHELQRTGALLNSAQEAHKGQNWTTLWTPYLDWGAGRYAVCGHLQLHMRPHSNQHPRLTLTPEPDSATRELESRRHLCRLWSTLRLSTD